MFLSSLTALFVELFWIKNEANVTLLFSPHGFIFGPGLYLTVTRCCMTLPS